MVDGELPIPARCPRCFMRWEHCLCKDVVKVDTATHFLVLRHAKEICKSSNTGRLVAMALNNSSLVEWGVAGQALDERVLKQEGTWVLYPDGEPADRLHTPPRTLVVLDGSWPQARHMLHRIPTLRTMPRVSLPPPEVAPLRLRQPPLKEGMSTLEAVAKVVALLEGEPKARPLRELHATMVKRVMITRGTWPGEERPRPSPRNTSCA